MGKAVLIQPVILSGGSGTRLWPLARESYPKQLLSLFGEDSLLQATVRRVDEMGLCAPMIVCNEEYRFVVAEQLRLMGKSGRLLLEPCGRNTAPALTVAALAATSEGADPILLVMPSDHVILDTPAFQAAVREGAARADRNALVTFGVVPDSPETGYGYIQAGPASGQSVARPIQGFVEKPDLAAAQECLSTGNYLWNSGLFMMRASVWIAAIGAFRADILAACREALAQASVDGEFLRVGKEAFERCPSDSIDYAVMERITTAGIDSLTAEVIPLSVGWSDVGSWEALWKALPKDDENNVVLGDALLNDCRDTLAISTKRLVTCVGLDNLVVIETPDAILVANKNKTQAVKQIVDHLKRDGRSEVKQHRRVSRPWGSYDAVDVGERFLVKRIIVNPGARLSLQRHEHRAEHWVVVRGRAKVTQEDSTYWVAKNESTFIPLGKKHRLENLGSEPLEMIEVQSGDYLGEDDIIRFDDIYGR